jgi:hypothetical protein
MIQIFSVKLDTVLIGQLIGMQAFTHSITDESEDARYSGARCCHILHKKVGPVYCLRVSTPLCQSPCPPIPPLMLLSCMFLRDIAM